jgi:hypothetical protein
VGQLARVRRPALLVPASMARGQQPWRRRIRLRGRFHAACCATTPERFTHYTPVDATSHPFYTGAQCQSRKHP